MYEYCVKYFEEYMELCSLVVDYDEDERLGLNIAGECQWYEDGSLSIIIIEDDVKCWSLGRLEYMGYRRF